MTDSAVATEQFRISPATYLRISAGDLLPRLIAICAFPTAALLIGSIFDVRLLLVALILLFLVVPFAVFHIYFTRLLTPSAREALAPRIIEIHPGKKILIHYLSSASDSDSDDSRDSRDADHSPAPEPLPAATIGWDRLEQLRIKSHHIVLTAACRPYTLLIPLKALPPGFDTMIFSQPQQNAQEQP